MLLKEIHYQNKNTENISELRFLEDKKTFCKNSYKNVIKSPIYTIFKGNDFIKMNNINIKTNFWIDYFINSFPSWNRFPKRNNSLECYSSILLLPENENHYVVIPFDNSRLVISSNKSFYKSFNFAKDKLLISSLDNDNLSLWLNTLKSAIYKLLDDENIKDEIEIKSYKEFLKVLDETNQTIYQNKSKLLSNLKTEKILNDEERLILKNVLNKYITSLLKYFEECVDPENNNFIMSKIEGFNHQNNDCEIWFNGPCLLIKHDKYVDLYQKGIL